jgi:D-glycero-alpha-D-manno-heptose-7-phosphate kinase
LNSLKNIEYDGKYDLIKSVLNVMNPKFGMDIYLHNDIPGGRGLGSSASLAVLLVKIISHLDNSEFDDYKIAEMAFKAEREELKIAGGWQDQYAAVSGGFNYMEFDKAKNIIYPLKLKDRVVSELNSRLMLCFVGQSHSSRDQHTQQREDYHKSEEENIKIHNEHKSIAVAIKDALLTNEIEEVGKLLHESWMSKRKLSGAISNPNIDRLYNVALKNGAYGGRLLGSGGGGYILLAYSPMKRHQLTKALKEDGGEILNFNFEFEGTKIWQSK